MSARCLPLHRLHNLRASIKCIVELAEAGHRHTACQYRGPSSSHLGCSRSTHRQCRQTTGHQMSIKLDMPASNSWLTCSQSGLLHAAVDMKDTLVIVRSTSIQVIIEYFQGWQMSCTLGLPNPLILTCFQPGTPGAYIWMREFLLSLTYTFPALSIATLPVFSNWAEFVPDDPPMVVRYAPVESNTWTRRFPRSLTNISPLSIDNDTFWVIELIELVAWGASTDGHLPNEIAVELLDAVVV